MPPPRPPSPTPANLPWHWLVETLAALPQADTSLISGVISVVPGFWREASAVVREKVALKYLEERVADGDEGPGKGIDVQRSSEDVLCSHLRKEVGHAGFLKQDAELSSNDIRQFILQKKVTLPKSSLDQLNELILQGKNGGKEEQVNLLKLSTGTGQIDSGVQGLVTLSRDFSNVYLPETSGSEKHLRQENLLDGDTINDVNRNIGLTGGTDVLLLEKSSKHFLSGNIGCSGGEIRASKQTEMIKHVNAHATDTHLQCHSASQQHLLETNALDPKKKNSVQLEHQSSPSLLPCRQTEMTKNVDGLVVDSCSMGLQDPSAPRQHSPKFKVSDGNRKDGVQILRNQVEMIKHVNASTLDTCHSSMQDPSTAQQHLLELNVSDPKTKTDVQLVKQSTEHLLPCKEVEMSKRVDAPAFDSSLMSMQDPSTSLQHLPKMSISDHLIKQSSCSSPHHVKQSTEQLLLCKEVEMSKHVDAPAFNSCLMSSQDPSTSRHHLPKMSISDQFIRQSSCSSPHHKQNTSLQHTLANGSRKNSIHSVCENDHLDDELCVVPETPTDGSVSEDTTFNFDPSEEILNIKNQLLSSQIHANPDSVAGKHSENVLCIKCDKGGQLLSCSAKGCLISVHQICLDPSIDVKGSDLFYCPFCSYTRAAIAYSKAKTDLSNFIGRDVMKGHLNKVIPVNIYRETTQTAGNEHMDHQSSFHSHECEGKICQHIGMGDGNVCYEGDVSHTTPGVTNGEMVNRHPAVTNISDLNATINVDKKGEFTFGAEAKAPQCEKDDARVVNMHGEVGNGCEFNGVEELEDPRVSVPTVEAALLHERMATARAPEKDGNYSVNEHAHIGKLKDQEKSRAGSDREICRVASSRHLKRSANRKDEATACKTHHDQEIIENMQRDKSSSGSSSKNANAENPQVRAVHGDTIDLENINLNLPERHAKRRRCNAAISKIHDPCGSAEKSKKQNSSSTRKSKRTTRQKLHFDQGVVLGRRHKLFWTPEEEEILKEAMHRFPVESSGNYPWTKILEFGRHVFHTTRQPHDLKDKWRNLKKKESKI